MPSIKHSLPAVGGEKLPKIGWVLTAQRGGRGRKTEPIFLCNTQPQARNGMEKEEKREREETKPDVYPSLSLSLRVFFSPTVVPAMDGDAPADSSRERPDNVKEQVRARVEHVRLLRELDLVVVECEPLFSFISTSSSNNHGRDSRENNVPAHQRDSTRHSAPCRSRRRARPR